MVGQDVGSVAAVGATTILSTCFPKRRTKLAMCGGERGIELFAIVKRQRNEAEKQGQSLAPLG